MASSGNEWIDVTFDTAVRWLYALAEALDVSYEEVNVWIFCIFWPASLLVVASLIKPAII